MASGNKTPQQYLCSQCGRKFESARARSQHESASHKEELLQCMPCGKKFSSTAAFVQHHEASHANKAKDGPEDRSVLAPPQQVKNNRAEPKKTSTAPKKTSAAPNKTTQQPKAQPTPSRAEAKRNQPTKDRPQPPKTQSHPTTRNDRPVAQGSRMQAQVKEPLALVESRRTVSPYASSPTAYASSPHSNGYTASPHVTYVSPYAHQDYSASNSHDENLQLSGVSASDVGTAVAVGVGVAALIGGIATLAHWLGSEPEPASRVEELSESSDSNQLILPNLVPKGAWGRKYKPHMPLQLFDALRSYHLHASHSACSYCGFSRDIGKLVLHLEWHVKTVFDAEMNPIRGTLTFQEFQIVCWDCHDCKHSGWAQMEGRPCNAHMCHVNGWDMEQTEATLASHAHNWNLHQELSPSQWTYQNDAFWDHPVVINFLQRNPQERQNIKLGAMCTLRSPGYNTHPRT